MRNPTCAPFVQLKGAQARAHPFSWAALGRNKALFGTEKGMLCKYMCVEIAANKQTNKQKKATTVKHQCNMSALAETTDTFHNINTV